MDRRKQTVSFTRGKNRFFCPCYHQSFEDSFQNVFMWRKEKSWARADSKIIDSLRYFIRSG